MKKVFFFLVSVLCALTGNAQNSDLSAVFTSDAKDYITAGTSSYLTDKIIIGEEQYDAFKIGTSKAAGSLNVSVPAGTTSLAFHALSWSSATSELTVSYGETSATYTVTGAGISGNSPYKYDAEKGGEHASHFYTVDFGAPVAAETTVTFSCDNRLVFYGVNLVAAPAEQYPLNFDKDQPIIWSKGSLGRRVNGFKLNDQQVNFPEYNTVYLDATNQVMEVNAGETLKPAVIWSGGWMHGIVYVDLGNDGKFDEGDLVAHSPYTGNQNLATTISTFNAPEKAGEYRMRVKTDWVGDSQTWDGGGLDPAGRIGADGTMDGSNSIVQNGGHIIDLVLKVVEVPTTVDVVYTVKFGDEVVKTATVTETIGAAPSYNVAAPAYVQVAGMPEVITADTKAVELTTTLDETVPFEVGKKYVVFFRNGACRYYWNDSNEGVGNEVRWNGNPSDISSREELESYTETAKWTMGGNWATGFTFTNAVTGLSLTAPASITAGAACNLNDAPATSFDIVKQSNGHWRFYVHGDNVNFLAHTSHGSHRVTFWNVSNYGVTTAEEGGASVVQFEEIEDVTPVEPVETFPMEGVAYKFKNVSSQLYVKLVDDPNQCVTLGETPDEMYFTAVDGGWAISNSKGYKLGEAAAFWNVGNTATPIVWTIEEVEGGYAFSNVHFTNNEHSATATGYLGFDKAEAGQKAFRNKNYTQHHGVFNIWKFDEEELQPEVPDATLEETWANIKTLLAEAEAIKTLNEVTVTYDSDGYFEGFTSPIVGKLGYKGYDVVWAVCDGADYVSSFVDYFTSAADAEDYMSDFGGIASLEEILKNVIDDYNDAEVVLPEKGKTYIIYSDPYTFTKAGYSYLLGSSVPQPQGYNGPSTMAYGDGSGITNAFVWTCEGATSYEYENMYFEIETDMRYKFTNVADGTYLNWKNQDMWYLSGKDTPVYGTLKMQVHADSNLYRWFVIDMRDGSLNQAGGDCTGNTFSNWFYFEEFEPIVKVWDGEAPAVAVVDDATVTVKFNNADKVEATNFGVLGAMFNESGDIEAILFDALFGGVEFEGDQATLSFKKISEINAELVPAAKGVAAKALAAVGGVAKGKVVILGKSFKIDEAAIYQDVIEADYSFGGTQTGIDAATLAGQSRVFDLNGRRVREAKNGLFLLEGKKVVK